MLKRVLSVLVLVMLSVACFDVRLASAQSGIDSEAAKVRAKVETLDLNTRVEVKLRDKTKLKGQITGTDHDSFALANQVGANSKIFYADVAEVKKAGGGWSTKNWIILGSVLAGALVTWAIVKPALCDGGAQTRGPC